MIFFNSKTQKYQSIIHHLKQGSIINLGSGDGKMSNYLKLNMKSNIINADKQDGDLKIDLNKKISLKNNSFDNIIAGELIEHLFNPDSFFKECFRILKKQGIFIITTPNMTGIPYILSDEIGDSKKYTPHINAFNIEMLKYLLIKNKFQIINTKYINAFWNKNLILRFISFIFPKLRSTIFIVAKKV